MPVSFEYVARETASNLWRNRLMTIAAILTVAVSLSLVGAGVMFLGIFISNWREEKNRILRSKNITAVS